MKTFMGVKLEKIDFIASRDDAQRKAESGRLSPKFFMAALRASFGQMTEEEKKQEYEMLK